MATGEEEVEGARGSLEGEGGLTEGEVEAA